MNNVFTNSLAERAWFSVLVIGLALSAGWLIGTHPALSGVVVVAVVSAAAVVAWPMVGIFALVASLVIGQLVRIPAFGAEGAALPNDLIIPVVAAGWLLAGLFRKRVEFRPSPLSWPIAAMLVVFVLTFIAGAHQIPFLTRQEQISSALYIARWLEYALLFFIVADVVNSERRARTVVWSLFAAAGVLAVLGFIQLRLFPDFSFMVPQGWDPHIGRLLSTWFDPNFLGGFFAFITVLAAGFAAVFGIRKSIFLWILVSMLFAALVLTYSRSAYAAFLAGITVLTFLRSRRMFLVLVLVAAYMVTSVPRVQERVQGALSLDQTAQLRLVSWNNALTVYRDYPLTGIGYNTYRYVQVNYGFQKDAAEHSAGGSDSSLLTILVTTGPFGLLVYLWMLWASLSIAWSSYRHGATELVRGLGLGAFAGIASVIVHSFFINSLLFPHMMETLAIVLGVLVAARAWTSQKSA